MKNQEMKLEMEKEEIQHGQEREGGAVSSDYYCNERTRRVSVRAGCFRVAKLFDLYGGTEVCPRMSRMWVNNTNLS